MNPLWRRRRRAVILVDSSCTRQSHWLGSDRSYFQYMPANQRLQTAIRGGIAFALTRRRFQGQYPAPALFCCPVRDRFGGRFAIGYVIAYDLGRTYLIGQHRPTLRKSLQATRHLVRWFSVLFDRNTYSELRRRVIRGLLRRFFRTTEASLLCTDELQTAGIRRILVCRPNHRLGNLVLLTPLIADLERVFPDAKVDIVLAGDMGPELFQSFDNVEHIYGLSRRMVRHPISIMRTALRIRKARYDLAIDPCEASQSNRFLLAVAKATRAIGMPADCTADSTWAIAARRAPVHIAQLPVFLLRNALSRQQSESADDYSPLDLRLTTTERGRARQALNSRTSAEGRPNAKVVVGIFADATGAKRYDETWWLRFTREILTRHADYEIVEIVPPNGRSRLASNFPSFSSPSPREVAAMISNMMCFVSADCGVMHLACASGTPTIGLFCVTDAAKYAPYGGHNQAIETNGKSPEAVAQLAISIVEAVREDPASVARATLPGLVFENCAMAAPASGASICLHHA